MATTWAKESALAELQALAEATKTLAGERRLSEGHTRWLARTLAVLEEVFGRNSQYYLSFASFTWKRTGSFVVDPRTFEEAVNPTPAIEREHHKAYLHQLETARGLLLAAADHLDRTDLTSVYDGKDTPPESSLIVRLMNLVEHKLRKVVRERPEREKEIQDAFENILVGADIPYSRETESIEYSSKGYTPDFTLPKIEMAIEVKLCNREGREKEIIAEINDDIPAYQTRYGNLLFVVYDLGFIRDTERFVAPFEEQKSVMLRVVKH
ncbi:MAG: hypothetical protein HYY01_09980 [Chloroflexi bacterium]|nr:hypothetical protein [Chloroflexota bacterium]